jgi:hypothetical protein
LIRITDENRNIILDKYIETAFKHLNISKEVYLFACQRFIQSKNILSNEILEKEILQLYPRLLENK